MYFTKMQDYIINRGSNCNSQPPATVKQMPPAPQPVDPRMVAAAMQQMNTMQQAPMSSQDGMSITITIQPEGANNVYAENYVDPYIAQGQQFSKTDLGQALFSPYEETFNEEHRPIRKRATDILSNTLGFKDPEASRFDGFYDPATRRLYR